MSANPETDPSPCRLCLKREVDEWISLYCQCDSQQKLIAEMVMDLMQLANVKETDGLPQYICGECLGRLDKACTFQKLCIDTTREYKRKFLQGEEVANVEVCCRICNGQESEELMSVFCICAGVDKTIADMMKNATGVVRPSEEDDLPQNICTICFEKLVETYAFRQFIIKSDVCLRKDRIMQTSDGGDIVFKTEESFSQEETGWVIPGKRRRRALPSSVPVARRDEDMDPFIYLDAPNFDAERLKSLFYEIEDTEFYEQLLYDGVICCCGKLLENDKALDDHKVLMHSEREKKSGNNKCDNCNKRFQYLTDLNEHKNIRDKKLFYRCKICNILTKERKVLQMHFEFTRFHPILDYSEEERLSFEAKIETIHEADCRCCGCDEEFADGESLLDHAKNVHFEEREEYPMFLCMICYTSFSEKNLLIKHQLTYIGTRTYICREDGCRFKSDQRLSIKKHVEAGIHCSQAMLPVPEESAEPEITEYFCCFISCYKTFPTLEELEQHCTEDHAEQRTMNSHFTKDLENRVCYLCKRHFNTEEAYDNHTRSHTDRKYICSTCGLKYTTRDNLKKHEKTHERQAFDHVKYTYSCEQCPAKYATQYALTKHVKRIHEKIITVLCKTCGKGFVDKHDLKQHEVSKHMKYRPYRCTQCPRAFGSKQLLANHTITHTTDRPFQCTYCDNTYRYQFDCRRHEMAIHLEEKPFKCTFCEASFIRDRDLRVHVTSHTKIKLYACAVPDCGFSSNIMKKVKDHCIESHGMDMEAV